MKRMHQKETLGMPRECLNEKIVYLKKTITANTTIELDSLVPNWKDYDRIVVNCDDCNIPKGVSICINVTNEFNGSLVVVGIKSNTLVGFLRISQGSDEDSPLSHAIYALNNDTKNFYHIFNDITQHNEIRNGEETLGNLYGVSLLSYNKISLFSTISYDEL